jgi:hypothetical protein
MDRLARLQAIEIRHSEIQYHQVRLQNRSFLDCRKAIFGFSNHLCCQNVAVGPRVQHTLIAYAWHAQIVRHIGESLYFSRDAAV